MVKVSKLTLNSFPPPTILPTSTLPSEHHLCVCACVIEDKQGLPLAPLSKLPEDRLRQTSLPLGLFTRGQTTPRQTSLPLAPLSKLPGDRLH